MKSTQEEIKEIISRTYSDYKPLKLRHFALLHKHVRESVGDDLFLVYLKNSERNNPRPVYKLPDSIKGIRF